MKTVYILTNEAMPGIIKIGWTDNSIEQRMKELDKTATPLPFTCYYAKRVKDPTFVETNEFWSSLKDSAWNEFYFNG